jgi:hypothetical protein
VILERADMAQANTAEVADRMAEEMFHIRKNAQSVRAA